MLIRPDLSNMSHPEKDALIHKLFDTIEMLMKKVEGQESRVKDLEGQVAKNSKNSSLPPSSDWGRPKPKSLRKAGQNPTGGQKGHPGSTLRQAAPEEVGRIVAHAPPKACSACGRKLPRAEDSGLPPRQVFDLPSMAFEVVEHRVLASTCSCGQHHVGAFPESVATAVQYGPRIKAACVNLTLRHMMPLGRTGELMGELFGLPVPQASALAFQRSAAAILAPTVAAIGDALLGEKVVNADETGMAVMGKIRWLHAACSERFSHLSTHATRGSEAFAAIGILARFKNILVRDGWKAYRKLDCSHAMRNARHLRELTFVHEEMKQDWAKGLIDLLLKANARVLEGGGPLGEREIALVRRKYASLMRQGEAINPTPIRPPKRMGFPKQNPARNLLDRLIAYADDVWRFASDPGVPFTNNEAERAVRMPKVKQKISGGFRTAEGLEMFCVARSYLETLRKQGFALFESLVSTFEGNVPQPRFVF
jgi:transposase